MLFNVRFGPITDIALFDHKRTFRGAIAMTALPPTADISGACWIVR